MAAGATKNKTGGKTPAKTNSTAKTSQPNVSKAAQDALNAAKEREIRRFWSYILFFWGILELLITFIKGEGLALAPQLQPRHVRLVGVPFCAHNDICGAYDSLKHKAQYSCRKMC